MILELAVLTILAYTAWIDHKTGYIPIESVCLLMLLSLVVHIKVVWLPLLLGVTAYLIFRALPHTERIGGGDLKLTIAMLMLYSSFWFVPFFLLSLVFLGLQLVIRYRVEGLDYSRYGIDVFLSYACLVLLGWIGS